MARSFRDLPLEASASLAAVVPDLEDPLRIRNAHYNLTRYPGSLPDVAPTDHFGRLKSLDALLHAPALVEAVSAALA